MFDLRHIIQRLTRSASLQGRMPKAEHGDTPRARTEDLKPAFEELAAELRKLTGGREQTRS